jgi:hypothetical protein
MLVSLNLTGRDMLDITLSGSIQKVLPTVITVLQMTGYNLVLKALNLGASNKIRFNRAVE